MIEREMREATSMPATNAMIASTPDACVRSASASVSGT
jgi:hypothetical protein